VSYSGIWLSSVISCAAKFANRLVRKPGELRDAERFGTREGSGIFQFAVFFVQALESHRVENVLIFGHLSPDRCREFSVANGFDGALIVHGRSPFFDCLTPCQGNSQKGEQHESTENPEKPTMITVEISGLKAPNKTNVGIVFEEEREIAAQR